MGKMTIAVDQYRRPKSAGQFDALLKAWQRGEDVAWADLMAAWVKAPTAPATRETILKIIQDGELICRSLDAPPTVDLSTPAVTGTEASGGIPAATDTPTQ